jgi:hypothetical protein
MDKNWTVKRKSEINNLTECQLGEIVFCEDTHEYYMRGEDCWMELAIDKDAGLNLNLYDLNKSIISQLKPLEKADIFSKVEIIKNLRYSSKNKHYMLLCKDYSYYTIFEEKENDEFFNLSDAVLTIAFELGDVYSIEKTGDGAIEIWIKPTGEEEPYAFYLFPYDAGVVYYE